MAAAAPKTALKGLMGGAKKIGQQVVVSISPWIETDELAVIFDNVLKSSGAAKSIGSNVASGNISGDGFEIFTIGDLDTIKKLVVGGKLTLGKDLKSQKRTLEDFGKPMTDADLKSIKDRLKFSYQDNIKHNFSNTPKSYEQWEKQYLQAEIDDWKEENSTIHLYDKANETWYTVSTQDSSYAETPSTILKNSDSNDPIKELWYDHMVYDDLSYYEFSKSALETIKQKGLYRDMDNVFGLRRVVDEFGKFGISLPADIGKEIAKLNKGRIRFNDLKPGETETAFHDRKEAEKKQHAKKEKEDFDKAPQPQETPDSWHTQSVEFEHKLVARLRRL